MSLSRDQILAADDKPVKEVPVPEWGGTVYVRTMSGLERDRLEAQQQANPSKEVRARFVVAACCDADGELLFTEADIPALNGKNVKALDRIFDEVIELNRLSKDAVDDAEKNSEAGP
jgi:hypothetical protein